MQLTCAMAQYGHTAALRNGEVNLAGASLDFVRVEPAVAAYRRMVRDVEFDICELAATTYFIARSFGAPFKALPIFLTRRFHPQGLMVRPDAGITTPKDLEGKYVGVRAYSVTTGVWARAFLMNQCGLDSSKVTWVVDDEEHVTQMELPPNVRKAPPGESLVSLMASGQIQAAFSSAAGLGRVGAPKSGWDKKTVAPATDYIPLLPNAFDMAADWYRRSGIYPFHGVIVVRDEILEKHPGIAGALFDAFHESKRRWLPALASGQSKTTDDNEYRTLMPIVGPDPIPYGINRNRRSIEALIDFSVQQGLLKRRMALEDLFVGLDEHTTSETEACV